MIRGIHYFSAEVKPKLMSSQGAALSLSCAVKTNFHQMNVASIYMVKCSITGRSSSVY